MNLDNQRAQMRQMIGGQLVLLRHKLLKAYNDAAFKRRGDGRFCWNSAQNLGLRLVCDAVILVGRFNHFERI